MKEAQKMRFNNVCDSALFCLCLLVGLIFHECFNEILTQFFPAEDARADKLTNL